MTLARIIKYLAILIVVVVLGVFIAWKFYHREIEPTVLDTDELEAVNEKLTPIINTLKDGDAPLPQTLVITERELNGYLNHHTEYGKNIKFTLLDGVIHADVFLTMPDKSPVLPNKKLRAEGEVSIAVVNDLPEIIITSISSMGVELPKDLADKYIGTNLYPMLIEKSTKPLPKSFISSIEISTLR